MIKKRDIKIEKLKERKFLIKVYLEDEVTAEEFLKHYENITQTKTQAENDLNSIDEQVKVRKDMLNEQLKNMIDEDRIFSEHTDLARLWKKEGEMENDRKGIGKTDKAKKSEDNPGYV
jgi:predicted nucleotidyltransferase